MARKPGTADKPAKRKRRRPKLTTRAAAPNLFLCGIGGLLFSLAVSLIFRDLQPAPAAILSLIAGLSCAVILTGVPGILRIKFRGFIATGSFAVFVWAVWVVMSAAAPGALPQVFPSEKKAP